jgi:predicted  nucleic acid-binding Zn ribbon protein
MIVTDIYKENIIDFDYPGKPMRIDMVNLFDREQKIKALRGKYPKSKMGKISIEKLAHFNCPDCSKWFSIGDAPTDKIQWVCPWCFEVNEYKVEE